MSEFKAIEYPVFSVKDVEIRDQSTVFQGFFKIDRYTLRHKLFGGGWSDWMQREIFERGHAAAVLPYHPASDQIVLVEQFRAGALASSPSPWLLEIIAGMVAPGETMAEVAMRESREEAGLTITELTPMLSYLSSPGGTTERIQLYFATLDTLPTEGIFGLAHEHEDIRVHLIPRPQALQWLEEGRIDNAATVIALQWLALHYNQLFPA
ncbi:ADP-ribose diphosphatase [Alkalimonas amylolytica]|uniref:ADP-ribose pyrophosphatase n=1 Tax=Alkalimonas amylolytica TaxID=152573 RepID=A0A1H3XPS7_ALKAM|nr:ADP-ribose diphosphatase [Alkalimonas amylolytica]SEA00594.1 ADP-ribose pyrophosphatase [Alkalimonas amylolytica]